MAKADETYAREIGQRIITARKEHRLGPISQLELAELIQVSERSMQAYESGQTIPYRKLKDLSEVLERPMGWLLHGDNAQEAPGELRPVLETIVERLDRMLELMEGRVAVTH